MGRLFLVGDLKDSPTTLGAACRMSLCGDGVIDTWTLLLIGCILCHQRMRDHGELKGIWFSATLSTRWEGNFGQDLIILLVPLSVSPICTDQGMTRSTPIAVTWRLMV